MTRLNKQILKRAVRITALGGSVQAYAMQRHFRSQRSHGIVDARMDCKLETSNSDAGRVKHQPEWTTLFAELLRNKRANIQFGYVVHLPWGTEGLDSRKSLKLITDSWIALKPLLDTIRKEE